MKIRQSRRRPTVLLVLIVLFAALGGLYDLHDRYHVQTRVDEHIILCGQNFTLPPSAAPASICGVLPCTEILPSGDLVSWYFTFC
jgi:hypothetical protein